MNQFSVHKADAVKKLLNKSKTDILCIPPGFTSILQPLDIYINKSLKDQLRSRWEKYMLEAEFNHKVKNSSTYFLILLRKNFEDIEANFGGLDCGRLESNSSKKRIIF